MFGFFCLLSVYFVVPFVLPLLLHLCGRFSGILHRDIKPENILLVDDGAGNLGGVTLSDFGFSHQVLPKSRLACGKQVSCLPSPKPGPAVLSLLLLSMATESHK